MKAVEWFLTELEKMQYFIGNDMLEAYNKAIEMEKQQAKDYAKFAIYCDRKELPILNFEDYIKLQ